MNNTNQFVGKNYFEILCISDYIHFIYFSLASLTTVGFGDIYAVSTPAKMLATFLSTLGILFPAIVIARLVGLATNQR